MTYRDLLGDFKRLNGHHEKKSHKRRAKGHGKASTNETTKETLINVWNMAITNDDFKPDRRYLEDLNEYYNSSLRQVDAGKPELNKLLLDEVNEWARGAGFAEDVLTKKDISDPNLVMMLLSAINLEAHWFEKFREIDYKPTDEEASKPGPSLLKEGAKCLIRDEYVDVKLRVYGLPKDRGSYRVIKIPLKSGVNFIILEPGEYEELAYLEERLFSFPGLLAQILFDLHKIPGSAYNLVLPPFKFETDLDLIEPLRSAGVKEIFEPGRSFAGISSKVKLFVSKARHRALIEVNKFGIKGAALTNLDVNFKTSAPLKLETLYVKNPFMFVIEYKEIPLFIGHVVSV